MNLQSLFKTIGYKGEFVWEVTVIPLRPILASYPGYEARPIQMSDATPLCLLKEVFCNVLVSVCVSLLVCYLELRGAHYSVVQFILSASLLDGRIHYLECLS